MKTAFCVLLAALLALCNGKLQDLDVTRNEPAPTMEIWGFNITLKIALPITEYGPGAYNLADYAYLYWSPSSESLHLRFLPNNPLKLDSVKDHKLHFRQSSTVTNDLDGVTFGLPATAILNLRIDKDRESIVVKEVDLALPIEYIPRQDANWFQAVFACYVSTFTLWRELVVETVADFGLVTTLILCAFACLVALYIENREQLLKWLTELPNRVKKSLPLFKPTLVNKTPEELQDWIHKRVRSASQLKKVRKARIASLCNASLCLEGLDANKCFIRRTIHFISEPLADSPDYCAIVDNYNKVYAIKLDVVEAYYIDPYELDSRFPNHGINLAMIKCLQKRKETLIESVEDDTDNNNNKTTPSADEKPPPPPCTVN